MARIITGNTYPYSFAVPRTDRYDRFQRVKFMGLGRLVPKLAIGRSFNAAALPMAWPRADLIHSFNVIPALPLPFVVSFEGELPRAMQNSAAAARVRRLFRSAFTGSRCRGLFALSEFAVRLLKTYAHDWPEIASDTFAPRVMYPTVPLRGRPKPLRGRKPVLTFVGKEWARKGGAVCARLAARLRRRGIAFEMHVVSSFVAGIEIYTDTDRGFYEADIRSLEAEDVTVHGRLANAEVLALLDRSDLVLLPTFDDSFGYSLLEAMAGGTPCLATAICAIPEVIDDGVDGMLVDLPRDAIGRWAHVYTPSAERSTDRFRDILNTSFDALAAAMCDRIEAMLDGGDYLRMSEAAIAKVEARFDVDRSARAWHDIYAGAIAGGR